MANFKKDIMMVLTVKDKEGKTFDSVESLNFEFQANKKTDKFYPNNFS